MSQNAKRPILTGQRKRVFDLIKQHQPILSLELIYSHKIPQAHARVSEMVGMGFNIDSTTPENVFFDGKEWRGVVRFIIRTPEWMPPQASNDGEGA